MARVLISLALCAAVAAMVGTILLRLSTVLTQALNVIH